MRNFNVKFMVKKYIVLDDTEYYVDLEEVMCFVTNSPKTERDVINNIRYDLIKNFLNELQNLYFSETPLSFEHLSLGQKLSFNTLVKYGIIVNKK